MGSRSRITAPALWGPVRGRALTSALVGVLMVATSTAATAADPHHSAWTISVTEGEGAGIVVDVSGARLDPAGAHLAPPDPGSPLTEGSPDAPAAEVRVPTGLLTLPARHLGIATDRVTATVDGYLPEGSTATVDVRGKRPNGAWSEWFPLEQGSVVLPEQTNWVQPRVVLAGDTSERAAIREVHLTASTGAHSESSPAEDLTQGGLGQGDPTAGVLTDGLRYRVFATREGLVGGTTANGHRIVPRDHFVALPSRRALAPRGSGDYSVQVCAPNGRCAYAPVWDVGPWNTRDDYWNPPSLRQEWQDLPQGLPQAQAARDSGHNGGRDQFGRRPSNPAGIDLGDGMFWDALGLHDNAWVTVDYLWTGSTRLAAVTEENPVDVVVAPDADAAVVGVAAATASVPAQCTVGGATGWLRIGAAQYVRTQHVRTQHVHSENAESEGAAAVDVPECAPPALEPAAEPTETPAAVPTQQPAAVPTQQPAAVPTQQPAGGTPYRVPAPTAVEPGTTGDTDTPAG